MDHEWSTSALSRSEVGWDWFALQLDDGREVMLYRIRRADGSSSDASSGSVVDAGGTVTRLGLDDASITATGTWRSPHSGVSYPSGWAVRVPGAGLSLEIEPLVADQELNVALRYWEGAVRVTGSASGRPVTGCGYVELAGYE